MTTSLVTGGSGYFGSLLVERLVAAGDSVRVLDISDASDRPSGVAFVAGDIRDESRVAEAVAGCDVVYHNVAQVPLAKDPALLRSVNVDGTRVLLGADILFYPTAIGWHPSEKAEFGEDQVMAWRTIQRSHAIANGVYVASPNRVGFEPEPGTNLKLDCASGFGTAVWVTAAFGLAAAQEAVGLVVAQKPAVNG